MNVSIHDYQVHVHVIVTSKSRTVHFNLRH
jgi:hypothetical protein